MIGVEDVCMTKVRKLCSIRYFEESIFRPTMTGNDVFHVLSSFSHIMSSVRVFIAFFQMRDIEGEFQLEHPVFGLEKMNSHRRACCVVRSIAH